MGHGGFLELGRLSASTIQCMSSGIIHYEEAAAQIAAYAARLAAHPKRGGSAAESVALSQAQGRVLALPLRADRDLPPFARSTRDGFACRALDANAHAPLPIAGATRAGDAPAGPLAQSAGWEIMTGAAVPAGADAVMMVEHVEVSEGSVRLLPPRTVSAGENIVPQGAEARNGAELLPTGTQIGSAQIALAASCGYSTLEVFTRPRVAILATGDELVPVEATPKPGQIRNSNSPMLAAMVAAVDGEPWILPVAADDAAALDALLEQACAAELLLITGGVSAGKFDLVEPALARAGARFHFTGVLMQPGKPVVFGDFGGVESSGVERSPAQCPFLGLPGNPVSSAVTFLLFAAPLIAALAKHPHSGPRFAQAKLAEDVKQKPGLTRFLPAWCNTSGEVPEVALVPWQGSGDLAGLARSNCLLVLPEQTQQLKAGETVQVLLL